MKGTECLRWAGNYEQTAQVHEEKGNYELAEMYRKRSRDLRKQYEEGRVRHASESPKLA